MKAVDVFIESCKAFGSHGLVTSFVKNKNLWMKPSYEEYINSLAEDVKNSNLPIVYKQYLLKSTVDKNIDNIKTIGPTMYTLFNSVEHRTQKEVAMLLNFLYYAAKAGNPPVRPTESCNAVKDAITQAAPIESVVKLAGDSLKFDNHSTMEQVATRQLGAKPSEAERKLKESCANFQEWGIRYPNDIDAAFPDDYNFDSLRGDINAVISNAKLHSEFTREMVHGFLCTATSTLDLWALIFVAASAHNISDAALKDLILKLLYVEVNSKGHVVDKAAFPATLKELRSDAKENYNILDCRAMVDEIIRYRDSDTKEEYSVVMTEESAMLASLTTVFEGVYRTHGMMRVLTTINAAIKTMPEASIQSDFYRLLKHYMDEEDS